MLFQPLSEWECRQSRHVFQHHLLLHERWRAATSVCVSFEVARLKGAEWTVYHSVSQSLLLHNKQNNQLFILSFSLFIYSHASELANSVSRGVMFWRDFEFVSNVHLDLRTNWLDFGCRKSRSLCPHGTPNSWIRYLRNAVRELQIWYNWFGSQASEIKVTVTSHTLHIFGHNSRIQTITFDAQMSNRIKWWS